MSFKDHEPIGVNSELCIEGTPYKISFIIGIGGVGRVYLAQSPQRLSNAPDMAVKVMHDYVAEDPLHYAIFAEAFRIRKMMPEVPQNVLPMCYDNELFKRGIFCTTFVGGLSLEAEGNALSGHNSAWAIASIREITDLARRNVQTLGSLLAHALVHCDLRPSNIILPVGEQAAFIDYDFLTKSTYRHLKENLTWGVGGDYMAPEMRARLGPRKTTDVYTIGVVIWHMIKKVIDDFNPSSENFDDDVSLVSITPGIIAEVANLVPAEVCDEVKMLGRFVAQTTREDHHDRPASGEALLDLLQAA